MATANADCLVICQIETPAAVAAAAGIAAEDGVDGLFFGRVDLAATSGGAGLDHPSQEAAAAATLGAARAAAKPVGLIVGGAHDAAMAKAAGATMFVLGTEHALLTRQIASQLDELSQSRGTT
jgi:2-keto-3-deoxy-L-rhamnonate aldolase RhmA